MKPPTGARTDERLGHVVKLLAENATIVASGTKIAAEIGTTRSEVWRLVQQLRAMGVAIAGHPATGYQLQQVPDLLLPEFLKPQLRGSHFGKNIHHFFRIGSTNTEAMAAAAEGEPEGAVFVAEEQTAGRGRGGHSWQSEASAGIYCSIVLRPQVAPAEILILTLAAGLAVQEAVERVTGIHADLRWPNDLLLGGKKFCGILAEMTAEATRVRFAVLGVGLNVNQTAFPRELAAEATSLRMHSGREWSRVELAAALLKSLDREYHKLVSAETQAARESVIRRFEVASSYALGRRVRIEEDGGYDGVTEGLDPRGFLRVRTSDGMKTVLSGGVREA